MRSKEKVQKFLHKERPNKILQLYRIVRKNNSRIESDKSTKIWEQLLEELQGNKDHKIFVIKQHKTKEPRFVYNNKFALGIKISFSLPH